MTIISSEKIIKFDRLNRPRTKTIWHLKCDNLSCNIVFVGRHDNKNNLHFHAKKCMEISSRIGGKLYEVKSTTCLNKYGVSNPFQNEKIKQQIVNKNVENYGVKYPQQRDEIRKKTVVTNLEKFNSSTPLTKENMSSELGKRAQTEKSKLKRKNTVQLLYGVDHISQNREIHLKQIQNKSKIICHWKTSERLNCVCSYEIAFVNWCNLHQIDLDWQISFKTPIPTSTENASTYIIDAFIKDGTHANTWIEIKGYFRDDQSKQKWEWFHSEHVNSELWNYEKLNELGILK